MHQGNRSFSPCPGFQPAIWIDPYLAVLEHGAIANSRRMKSSPAADRVRLVQPGACLGKPHLLQRGDCIATTDVWNDVQFKLRDPSKVDAIIPRLGACAVGAEVPLLPNDFLE